MEYSIVIPAYNESDKISTTLTQVTSFMRTFSSSYEILVVDDGSKDTTARLVKEFQKDAPEVILIENPHKGKGYAVRTGMLAAQGDFIYTADADLSAPITELKKLSIWVKDQGFDIVIASREGVGAQRVGEPLYRHVMGRVFNALVRFVALPGIKDSQCGFKLFRAAPAKDIFNSLKIYGDDVKELKTAFLGAWDVEVLYIAHKRGYTIKEVPVVWTFVKTTRLNPLSDSVKMALDLLKIRINDLKGVYSAQGTSQKHK